MPGKRLVDELWQELVSSIGIDKFPETYLFRDAYRLFSQAAMSFESGAYDAVGLLCRSTLEAACYLFLTRKKKGKVIEVDAPLALDGKVRTVQFEELKRGIEFHKVLSKEEMKKLSRIQEHGNVIAHLAARHDRDVMYSLTKPEKSELWLSEQEAMEDLKDTSSLLAAIAKSLRNELSTEVTFF